MKSRQKMIPEHVPELFQSQSADAMFETKSGFFKCSFNTRKKPSKWKFITLQFYTFFDLRSRNKDFSSLPCYLPYGSVVMLSD